MDATNVRLLNFIDGTFVEGSTGQWFDDICPTDGKRHAIVCEASRDDVDRAVRAARTALHGPWGRATTAERVNILAAIAAEIERRFDEFLAAEVADTGKPHSLARAVDIPRGAANFRSFASILSGRAAPSFSTETPDQTGAINYAVRKPKGVIAVISPWNLPLLLMTWKVSPALACGNTVVVKPSEETPYTATLLGEVMNTVGVPPGVFNVVHGFGPGSAGAFLAEHEGVDAITFTGETKTGEEIMRAAAAGTRDLSAELGGKNPAIVFADADIDAAIEGTARSSFTNCGQVCLCTERVYVERPIFERFVEGLAKEANSLVPGTPQDAATTIGPLISNQHREKVTNAYRDAVNAGASVMAGGGVPAMADALAGGFWVEPTVWTGLSEDSVPVQEEIFGPVCHVAPFDDEDEELSLANSSPYGLAATLWTQDLSRAHRVSPEIEAGIVWVNTWNLRDLRTPFGGVKRSGIGREGGFWSLDFYSETKNVCIKL
ncbi:MAG: 2-hydroxymuconic semialdehyde dehydrogenase [Pseudomonadota bacterium]